MEWWIALAAIFAGLVLLMVSGLPVAFAFLFIDILGAIFIFGGSAGLEILILNIEESMTNFSLLPVPLFIFMGVVLFQSGIGVRIIDTLDKWIGRVPGRLSLLTVASATIFACMSGSTVGTSIMLGKTLMPEMEKRGYKKSMTVGPILGCGGLAMLIPPSALAVLLASLAKVSVGKLLIAGIMPGLLLAAFFAIYIVGRSTIQPSVAPPYEGSSVSLSEKSIDLLRYVFPCIFIIFLTVGVIFLGVATPSEAAALGSIGMVILAAAYRRLNWEMIKTSIMDTVSTSAMLFIIIIGSMTFSQILAFSGASAGLVQFISGLNISPLGVLILMQLGLMLLGCFMDNLSMVMVALPVYLPVIHLLGFEPIWFSLLILINMETANITPPFGLVLFAVKGIASSDTTIGDIYKAALPFVICDVLAMAVIIIFPQIALWLPALL